MSNNNSGDLVRASGLWVKQGRNGEFWSGNLTEAIPAGARLLIFPNRKRKDGDADYTLMYSLPDEDQPPMRRAEPQRQQQPSRAPRGYDPETLKSFVTPDDDDDSSIPF